VFKTESLYFCVHPCIYHVRPIQFVQRDWVLGPQKCLKNYYYYYYYYITACSLR